MNVIRPVPAEPAEFSCMAIFSIYSFHKIMCRPDEYIQPEVKGGFVFEPPKHKLIGLNIKENLWSVEVVIADVSENVLSCCYSDLPA